MLEQILAAASDPAGREKGKEPAEIRALRAVAASFGGQPFVLRPVAIEMIHAILRVQFRQAAIPDETVRAMAEQIATTLYDDPTAHERLQALWVCLAET